LNWNRLVDEFFDEYFVLNPSQGTVAGFHQYDSELENYSLEGVDKEIAFATRYLCRLESIDSKSLPLGDRQDYELMVNSLKSTLLELESIRKWEKDPDYYSSGITESAFAIMSRNFAPPEDRLKSLVERQKKMPAVLTAAKANLKNPPHVYTKVAIQQLPGLIEFFHKDVPNAFAEIKDEKLLVEFRHSNAAVIAALREYQTFLADHLLAHSKGDFRIGSENYHKKLLYEEMVDVPLSRLLRIGYDDLRRNQQWVRDVAAEIDPKKSPRQVLAELKRDHPQPDNLLQAFRDLLGNIRQYIVDNNIVTLPSSAPPSWRRLLHSCER
jgi:uncharacterized protein (DUF885 family)